MSALRLLLLATLVAPVASAGTRSPNAAAVAAYVEAVLPLAGDADARVSVTRLQPSRPDVWRRARRIHSFQLQALARPYGQLSARVEVEVPGGLESLQLSAYVEVSVPVWVTTRSVGAGERVLDAAALSHRSMQGLSNTALRGQTVGEDQVITRPVPGGTVLTRLNTEAPLAVQRGDRVEVLAVVGAVVIRTRGEALRSGRTGDHVPVRGPGGNILQTVATGPGRVEVNP